MSMSMSYPWAVQILKDGKWIDHTTTFASKRYAKEFCKSLDLNKSDYRIYKIKGRNI